VDNGLMRNRGAQLAPALVRVGAAFGVAICIALSGCSSRAAQQPSTGIAYAGPANLNLRKDLAPKAPVVGTAHHGDRLEVIDSRRRFIKVRTAQGVEGWTDSNLLLTEQHMADLAPPGRERREAAVAGFRDGVRRAEHAHRAAPAIA
jgi:hypothetical protein